MARLIVATSEGQQTYELRSTNSLGRHPNNSIQLLDKIVSKEHCTIEWRDGHFILRDLGSLNGTFINGEKVRGEQLLKNGDEIVLGGTTIRYEEAVAVPSAGGGSPPSAFRGPSLGTRPAGASGAPPAPPTSARFLAAMPSFGSPNSSTSGPGSAGSGARSAVPTSAPSGAAPTASTPTVGPQQPPKAAPSAPRQRAMTYAGTRVDMLDAARAIGAQIAAATKGFAPFDQIASDPAQLRLDYERLRITWELTRDIGLERDLDKLLEKILLALFKFVKADRGVILLAEGDGSLQPRAARRRDGTEAPIQVSSTILAHVMKERASVLTHDAAGDFAGSKGKSMILNRISSAIVVPLLHERDVLGAVWLDSESLAQFQPKDLEIITAVANQAAMFIENTLLAKKIEQEIVARERFSRLLSPNVAEQVLSGKLEVRKGGVSLNQCSVFNSDIRGFTRMSEGTPADVMVDMLNEYFELMVETIFKFEGTLDKFMGDGIMAFWGAPVAHDDDPIRSVACALQQMEALGRFNQKRLQNNLPSLYVGMGIHTGPLVAGYVGSSRALSYTVIGDTANTSARLCGIAEAGQLIVSEATMALLGNRFEAEELPAAKLKGKEKPLRIFNVKRERPTAASK